jgi:acetylornithine deacetylase/succinyl-diaminopimelate desuccinylase-like protein
MLRILCCFLSVVSFAVPPAAEAAKRWREANERRIVEEFARLLSLPNIATNLADTRRNAEFIATMYQQRGVATRILQLPGAPPAVYGEILTPGATRTLLFYAHYDGQPVDASRWKTPPFTPVLRSAPVEDGGVDLPLLQDKYPPEARLFARASTDDKAPILGLAVALDALRAAKIPLRANIKFFFEGEEELGSKHLDAYLRQHKELLAGDVWFICDGPVHQTRRAQLYFGARGVMDVELTAYGAKRELHSGHYGGWAPNAAMDLSRLLASLTDGEGNVLVQGFYEGVAPLTKAESDAIAAAPDSDEAIRRELQFGRPLGDRKLLEAILRPNINVRGFQAGAVGDKAVNAVLNRASASLDVRMAKGMLPEHVLQLLKAHCQRNGWLVVDGEPTAEQKLSAARIIRLHSGGGYPAFRTPLDLPISREVAALMRQVHGEVIVLPTLGGSVPLYGFDQVFRKPMIGVPIANHDSNQHSDNENLRLANLWSGLETLAALLAM